MNDFNIKKFLTENKMTRNSRLLSENVSREEEIKKIIDDKVRQWRMDAGAQSVMIDDMPEEAMDAVMKKFRDEAESELGLNEELDSFTKEELSALDYHEKTGMIPDGMSEEEFDILLSKWRAKHEDEDDFTDPAGGSGLDSHI